MPEPEEGASEELNPTNPDTTPDDESTPPAESADTADLAASKIADLTMQLAVKDQRISELQAELDKAKSHNYDLLMAGGNDDSGDESDEGEPFDGDDDDPDNDPTIEDILYEKE